MEIVLNDPATARAFVYAQVAATQRDDTRPRQFIPGPGQTPERIDVHAFSGAISVSMLDEINELVTFILSVDAGRDLRDKLIDALATE